MRSQGKLSFKSLSASQNFLWRGCDGCQLSEARVWGDLCLGARPSEGIPFFLLGRWSSLLCSSGPTGPEVDRRYVGAGACRLRRLCPRAPLPPAGTGAGCVPLPLRRAASRPASTVVPRAISTLAVAQAAQRPVGAPGRTNTWRWAGGCERK